MTREVILDTSFILSAIREKIDFFEEISFLGLTPLIPEEVLREIKSIAASDKKLKFTEEAKLASSMLTKKVFNKIRLNSRIVDNGIIEYAKKNPQAVVATLDNEIKSKTKNNKLIIRGKQKLEII